MAPPVTRTIALVPDLPEEQWPSMDRYALRLFDSLDEQIMDGLNAKLTADIRSIVGQSGETPAGLSEPQRYYQRYYHYPREVKKHSADLFHVLDHSYGHVCSHLRSPSVVTVHDLFFAIEKPVAFGPRRWLKNAALKSVEKGLRSADAFIVGTRYLKDELATFLDSSENIFIAPFGVEANFKPPSAEAREEARRHFGIADDSFVILHVGSNAPRKNLSCVVNTTAFLRQQGHACTLLQVGAKKPPEAPAKLGSAGIWAGQTDETELRAAYHAADLLFFPSHYEGFGFPVLEAMANNLPVVGSGAGGMQEVAGDAAVLVPEGTASEYGERIATLIDDSAARNSLVERGAGRVAEFTWRRTASLTADVYRKVLS